MSNILIIKFDVAYSNPFLNVNAHFSSDLYVKQILIKIIIKIKVGIMN